jgi:hypothetical protein
MHGQPISTRQKCEAFATSTCLLYSAFMAVQIRFNAGAFKEQW